MAFDSLSDRSLPSYEFLGERLQGFFLCLPKTLLENQRNLGLSCQELVLLIHLASFKHDQGKEIFPSYDLLASRMNSEPRQIQRLVKTLSERGFLYVEAGFQKVSKRSLRIEQRTGKKKKGRQRSNTYDLTPLLTLLQNDGPWNPPAVPDDSANLLMGVKNDLPGTSKMTPHERQKRHARGTKNVCLIKTRGREQAEEDFSEKYQLNWDRPSGGQNYGNLPREIGSSNTDKAQTQERNQEKESLAYERQVAVQNEDSENPPNGDSENPPNGEDMAVIEDALNQALRAEQAKRTPSPALEAKRPEKPSHASERPKQVESQIKASVAELQAQASAKKLKRRKKRDDLVLSKAETGISKIAGYLWDTVWAPGMHKLYPDLTLPFWDAADLGRIKSLVSKFGLQSAALILGYTLANWPTIHLNWWKKDPGPGNIPGLGIALKGGASFLHAAQALKKAADNNANITDAAKSPEQILADVKKEVDAFYAEPGRDKYDAIPRELERRFLEAKRAAHAF